MSEAPNFQAEMRRLLRDRALDAARDLVCSDGWGAVNMSRVADAVGVSRPVLYKEFGAKRGLAEALVEREAGEFLAEVVACLAVHPADPAAGMADAAEHTLRTGADNALIKAILAGGRGTDAGLLPLLATDPEPVLARAIEAIRAAIRAQYRDLDLGEPDLVSAIEVIVRLTLSHLLQPYGTVEHAAAQIRRVAYEFLGSPGGFVPEG